MNRRRSTLLRTLRPATSRYGLSGTRLRPDPRGPPRPSALIGVPLGSSACARFFEIEEQHTPLRRFEWRLLPENSGKRVNDEKKEIHHVSIR